MQRYCLLFDFAGTKISLIRKAKIAIWEQKSCNVGWIMLTPLAENPEALQNFLQALRKILQCL